jgi:hypothetical protein
VALRYVLFLLGAYGVPAPEGDESSSLGDDRAGS